MNTGSERAYVVVKIKWRSEAGLDVLRRGIILGESVLDNGKIRFAVLVDGEEVTMFDESEVIKTKETVPHSDVYSGEIVNVSAKSNAENI